MELNTIGMDLNKEILRINNGYAHDMICSNPASEFNHIDNQPDRRRQRSTSDGDGKVKVTWRDLGYEFSQYTTLHGLRYIAQRDTFILRRIVWLLLTVTCSSLLVIQIVDRVQYFLQSPVAVNIKVNYNHSLQFPAITICNQNAFRATAASNLGLYRLIENMYSDPGNTSWLADDAENTCIRMDDLYGSLGHRKEDFIASCSWASDPCSADNFSVMLTDHGMCYTFNGFDGHTPQLNVTSSGVEYGLRLTLNVEQYEAMPGPHDATGVKLLATAQSDFPRVAEIGIAIPTGTHSFVGLGVLVINNLPKPHGDCGDRSLRSTTRYTPEMCTLECVTKYIERKCGCRNFYMPNLTGKQPVCTVEEYFDCYLQAYEYMQKRAVAQCACPTSCNYFLYESSVSYATTSAHVKGNLLDFARAGKLKNKFYQAREITSKMNRAVLKQFHETVRLATESYTKLNDLFAVEIFKRLQNQIETLNIWRENMTSSIDRKQMIYEYQAYSIQKNFMRARDAMEERTLHMVCLGFHEHVFNTELLLHQMRDTITQNKSGAIIIYTYLKNILQSRIETARRAFSNYTQLYSAYETGHRIFDYKFNNISRRDNEAIIPKPLLNQSLSHNQYAKRYSKRLGRDIHLVLKYVKRFEQFVDKNYQDASGTFNITLMHKLSAEFIDACEDFYHSKSTFYFEVIDRPLRIVQERMQTFYDMKRDFDQSVDEQMAALRTLKNSLSIIQSGLLYELTDALALAERYFVENADFENVTKLQLAEIFTSKHLSNNLHMLSLFFTEIRQKGQFVFEQWAMMKTESLTIWRTILGDIDSVEYYKYKEISAFLQNYTDVQSKLGSMVDYLQDENDLRNILRNTDNVFVQAVGKLTDELSEFREGNEMGETFIRDNFLQLDVYYKELRHEEIEQQKAYDAIALLCDIGGSLGLFIGASVITVFEIVDFFLNNAAVNMLHNNKCS